MTLRVGRAQFHQRSMYSFYARRSQKRKKDSQVVNLFTLLRSTSIKAARIMLVKLTPGVNFINILCTAFALVDPKSVKNTGKSSVSFYAFGIYKRKSCT